MLYREITAVCSQIHTKHINTLCGQNVGLVIVKPGARVYTVAAVLKMVKVKVNFSLCTPQSVGVAPHFQTPTTRWR